MVDALAKLFMPCKLLVNGDFLYLEIILGSSIGKYFIAFYL